MVDVSRRLIEPGRVVATPGALAALESAGVQPDHLLRRHLSGDWGAFGTYTDTVVTDRERQLGPMATADDAKLNRLAVDQGDGSRVVSKYELADAERTVLWIITEGQGEHRATTVLLPSEY